MDIGLVFSSTIGEIVSEINEISVFVLLNKTSPRNLSIVRFV